MKIPKKSPKETINSQKGFGRPRIYTPELLDALAEDLIDWVARNITAEEKQFLLGDWCFSVGFHKGNFKRYAEQNENFKRAYEWAKQWQEHQVTKGALNNTLNPRFSQFFLGCNHKWSTQEEPEHEEAKAKSRLEEVSQQLKILQRQAEEAIAEDEDEDDE